MRSIIVILCAAVLFSVSASAQSCKRYYVDSVVSLPNEAETSTIVLDLSAKLNRNSSSTAISARSYVRTVVVDNQSTVSSFGRFTINSVAISGGATRRIRFSGSGSVQEADGTVNSARISGLIKAPTRNGEGKFVGESTISILLADDSLLFSAANTDYSAPSFLRVKSRTIECE